MSAPALRGNFDEVNQQEKTLGRGGTSGTSGTSGSTGAEGPQGPPGLQGQDGTTGPGGDDGSHGTSGTSGTSGTAHRHAGTAGDSLKVPFANLATVPTGLTAGTTHSKTAHSNVTDRTRQMPLNNWTMASGTALGIVSSVTLPYFSVASGVRKVTWPANCQIKLAQDLQVPDNFSESANTQVLKAVVRSTNVTVVQFDSEMRIVRGGAALGADLNPATVSLATNGASPEEVSLVLTYQTLQQEDIVATRVFPIGNVTAMDVELFGSWLEYTAEE